MRTSASAHVSVGQLVNSVHSIGSAPAGVLVFFFFQAEDGIRDVAVTGVQTCALPILIGRLVGKGKGSGVEVGQPNATVLTIRDGLLIRSETGYTNRREALEAVGLSE